MRKDEFVSGNNVTKVKIWGNEDDLGNVELRKHFGEQGNKSMYFRGTMEQVLHMGGSQQVAVLKTSFVCHHECVHHCTMADSVSFDVLSEGFNGSPKLARVA